MKKNEKINYSNLGIQYENHRYDTEEKANLKSAIEINQNNDEAYNDLGILYNKQGRIIEAEESFKSAIEINPNNVAFYNNLAKLYDEQGKEAEAEAIFKSAIEINPNDVGAYNNLGILYNKQGKEAEAEAIFKSAIEINPKSERAYGNLGNLYNKQGKDIESEACYKSTIEIYPKSDNAYFGLGFIYQKQGKNAEAEASFKSAIEINPENVTFYNNLGKLYDKQGKEAEAEAIFKSAIEINPNDVGAYNNLGILYNKQGKEAEAEASFKSAIEINPKSERAYGNLGNLYQKQGKDIESEASYKSAIEINPQNDNAYFGLGFIYQKQGKDIESEASYKSAIEINPKNDNAYNNLGILFKNQEKYTEAEANYKSAIEINPNNDIAYSNLGNLYNNQELDTKALSAYENAFRINKKPKYNIKLAELQKKLKNYSLSLDLLLNNLGLEKIDLKVLESYLIKIKTKKSSEVEYQNVFSKIQRYNPLAKKIIEEVKKFNKIKNKNICLEYLIKIVANVNNFKEQLLVKNEQKSFELYQYTSLNTLKSILNLNQNDKNNITKSNVLIRLYNTDYMNDPEEGKFFIDLLREKLPSKLLESKYSVSHAFIASLTSTKDGIPMWSMYGDNSRGVSIGFKNLPLGSKSNGTNLIIDNDYADEEEHIKYNYIEEEAKLYRICYINPKNEDWRKSKELSNLENINDNINKLFKLIEDETNSKILYDLIGKFISIEFDRIKFLIKSSKYEYENEYRILRMVKDLRDESLKLRYDLNSPKLYLELGNVKINEVIFGVNSDNYIKWKPIIELKLPDLEIDQIVQSEIPVRYE